MLSSGELQPFALRVLNAAALSFLSRDPDEMRTRGFVESQGKVFPNIV